LLTKAAEAKLLRTNRVRADTTVVPANVAYPTDSGLLAKAVRRIAATSRRIQAAGGAVRTRVRDRSRAAGKRAHAVASKLRSRAAVGRDEATAAVLKSTGELAGLAQTAARDAQRLLVNAQRAVRRATAKAAALRARGERDAAAGRRRGRLVRAVNDLQKLVAATRQITAQTRQRVSGQIPDGATRRVSLHDGDARPIAKGRLGKPVEFGHKAQVSDNDDRAHAEVAQGVIDTFLAVAAVGGDGERPLAVVPPHREPIDRLLTIGGTRHDTAVVPRNDERCVGLGGGRARSVNAGVRVVVLRGFAEG
jgi:IS5 family transposase